MRLELEAYYRDFSNRNWPAFASHFWPGTSITTVWQPPGEPEPRVVPTTVEAFVEQAHLGPGSREIFEERMLEAQIDARGNIAHAWVRYRARFGDSTNLMEWEGTDVFSLLRHRGEWRIASLVFAGDDADSQ